MRTLGFGGKSVMMALMMAVSGMSHQRKKVQREKEERAVLTIQSLYKGWEARRNEGVHIARAIEVAKENRKAQFRSDGESLAAIMHGKQLSQAWSTKHEALGGWASITGNVDEKQAQAAQLPGVGGVGGNSMYESKEREHLGEYLRHVPLFTGMTERQINSLEGYMLERSYEPGDILTKQNDACEDLFVILKGRVSVIHGSQPSTSAKEQRTKVPRRRAGRHTIVGLGPGDYFGDKAFVSNDQRSASTITANQKNVVCACLSRQHYHTVLFDQVSDGGSTSQASICSAGLAMMTDSEKREWQRLQKCVRSDFMPSITALHGQEAIVASVQSMIKQFGGIVTPNGSPRGSPASAAMQDADEADMGRRAALVTRLEAEEHALLLARALIRIKGCYMPEASALETLEFMCDVVRSVMGVELASVHVLRENIIIFDPTRKKVMHKGGSIKQTSSITGASSIRRLASRAARNLGSRNAARKASLATEAAGAVLAESSDDAHERQRNALAAAQKGSLSFLDPVLELAARSVNAADGGGQRTAVGAPDGHLAHVIESGESLVVNSVFTDPRCRQPSVSNLSSPTAAGGSSSGSSSSGSGKRAKGLSQLGVALTALIATPIFMGSDVSVEPSKPSAILQIANPIKEGPLGSGTGGGAGGGTGRGGRGKKPSRRGSIMEQSSLFGPVEESVVQVLVPEFKNVISMQERERMRVAETGDVPTSALHHVHFSAAVTTCGNVNVADVNQAVRGGGGGKTAKRGLFGRRTGKGKSSGPVELFVDMTLLSGTEAISLPEQTPGSMSVPETSREALVDLTFPTPGGDNDEGETAHSSLRSRNDRVGTEDGAGGGTPGHLTTSVSIADLPVTARALFTVRSRDGFVLGWASCKLFDYQRRLIRGRRKLRLFPGEGSVEITTQMENSASAAAEGSVIGVGGDTGSFLDIDIPDVVAAAKRALSFRNVPGSPLAAGQGNTIPGGSALSGAHVGHERCAVFIDPREKVLRSDVPSEGNLLVADTAGGRMSVMATRTSNAPQRRKVLPRAFQDDVEAMLRRLAFATEMTEDETAVIWGMRERLSLIPEALPLLVRCMKWSDHDMASEFYDLLRQWKPCAPREALELLSYADPKVRAWAVHLLDSMPDAELAVYMIQLIRCVKFEANLDSGLVRFLLRRGIMNIRIVGQPLFWNLQAEMMDRSLAFRFWLILKEFQHNSAANCVQFAKQIFVTNVFTHIQNTLTAAMERGECKAMDEKKALLQALLEKATFPSRFWCPLDPNVICTGVDTKRCRLMASKQVPLWIEFTCESNPGYTRAAADGEGENGGGVGGAGTGGGESKMGQADVAVPNYAILFKVGDDLRQDQLTLQAFSVMNQLWISQGVDLKLRPYGCIVVGQDVGLIEIVPDCQTIASILSDYSQKKGGTSFTKAISASFGSDDAIYSWLLEKHLAREGPSGATAESSKSSTAKRGVVEPPESFKQIQDNFARSCAGYCVATYVLGIGDRHPSNILLDTHGHLVHIDFGHFLGNFKVSWWRVVGGG